MVKPSDIFKREKVFLAHCSGFAKGVGNSETDALDPLERLLNVIQTKPEISCSTIGTHDRFLISQEKSNFFGPIGLIVLPATFESITHSSASDGGTQAATDGSGRRTNTNRKNEPSDLEEAIINRTWDDYNEICVNHYEIKGLFIAGTLEFTDGVIYTRKHVYDKFQPHVDVFFLRDGIFTKIQTQDKVPIERIYDQYALEPD